jgi:hypothetical protein
MPMAMDAYNSQEIRGTVIGASGRRFDVAVIYDEYETFVSICPWGGKKFSPKDLKKEFPVDPGTGVRTICVYNREGTYENSYFIVAKIPSFAIVP